jgi:long-chain acyl-CoA synthetase
VVPMDPRRSAREVASALTNTVARLLVFALSCWPAATSGAQTAGVLPIGVGKHTLEQLTDDFLGRAWPVTRANNDNAVILHTSRTTGVPKGAQLTHSNLVSSQAVIARSLLNIGPDDVVLSCFPLFHAFGMAYGLGPAISSGGTLALLPSLMPTERWKWLRPNGLQSSRVHPPCTRRYSGLWPATTSTLVRYGCASPWALRCS